MKNTTKLLLATAAISTVSAAQATTVLDDNFNDNDRTNQSLTSSAQWFQSFNNLSVVEPVPASGNYALQNSPNSGTVRHAVAYYAPSGSPVSLATTGDTLNLSFDLTPTSATPADSLNLLRIGLLNSGTARQTADNESYSPSLIGGFGFFVNPDDQRVRAYGRSTDAGPLFASLGSGSGWVGGATGGLLDDSTPVSTFAMAEDTTYSISISIERLASGNLNIAYSTTDGVNTTGTSFIEDTYLNYDFDTIGFGWGDGFGDGQIDNVLITAIPEPSSMASIAALVALGCATLRRRRR